MNIYATCAMVFCKKFSADCYCKNINQSVDKLKQTRGSDRNIYDYYGEG